MSVSYDYDVFLSYSSKDKGIVHPLAERLKLDGLRVWLDEWTIRPGDLIGLQIQRGLERSRTLVLCMSLEYFESAWTTLEHQTLLFRDPTNAKRRFIPLLIADCTVPDVIAQFAYVDWRQPTDEAYTKLLNACRGEVVKPVSPDPEATADRLREHVGSIEAAAPTEERKGGDPPRVEAVPGEVAEPLAPCVVLQGHGRTIKAVTISPDGRTIVSGGTDHTVRVWDLKSGRCRWVLEGHTDFVTGIDVTPDGRTAVSSGDDRTLRIWSLEEGLCLGTITGHTGYVKCVAVAADGRTVASGAWDGKVLVSDLATQEEVGSFRIGGQVTSIAITPDGSTALAVGGYDHGIRVLDLGSGQVLSKLVGHSSVVTSVVLTPDGRKALSGSSDQTLRLWDLEAGVCVATMEGHFSSVICLAIAADGRTAVSGGSDALRVWDLETGVCLAVLSGYTKGVSCVAIASDGRTVVAGGENRTLSVWELPRPETSARALAAVRYTNAKVVLVGESGVGKTGLALRLAEDRWEETESTHGMGVWHLHLPGVTTSEMEREVWLWDFAGQPDYRLVHQLFMDETALALLVIDAQKDNPFEPLGHWEKALASAVKHDPVKLLIIARSDRGGLTISSAKLNRYLREHGYIGFLDTSAKTGGGCEELKTLVAGHIPWERLPWTSTTRLFKTLKDEILRIKEKGIALVRISELYQRLQLEMQDELVNERDLRAVVGLLEGQGLVKKLAFGDVVLLQPEQINNYASAVVRNARENTDEIGCVPERAVLEADVDFKDMQRLEETDEKILLRAMLQTFLDRSLCVREETSAGTQLVFPSYFKQDRPEIPEQPNIVVNYAFEGPLDEIYTTLVVRLSYTESFEVDQLWRYAADFKTPSGRRVGLLMTKTADAAADIKVHFEAGVPVDTQVSFIKYIHEHLKKKARNITRVRSYVCPHCNASLENRTAIRRRLELGKTDILCGECEERVLLIDLIEEKFASDEFLIAVQEMDTQAQINLDKESLRLILVGHAFSVAMEAGQIFQASPLDEEGTDGFIEFRDDCGELSGKRVCLVLWSGDSRIRGFSSDHGSGSQEAFAIEDPRLAASWHESTHSVVLVIRTSDGQIRWMNLTDALRRHGPADRQMLFDGEPFTALNVAQMRNRVLA